MCLPFAIIHLIAFITPTATSNAAVKEPNMLKETGISKITKN